MVVLLLVSQLGLAIVEGCATVDVDGVGAIGVSAVLADRSVPMPVEIVAKGRFTELDKANGTGDIFAGDARQLLPKPQSQFISHNELSSSNDSSSHDEADVWPSSTSSNDKSSTLLFLAT